MMECNNFLELHWIDGTTMGRTDGTTMDLQWDGRNYNGTTNGTTTMTDQDLMCLALRQLATQQSQNEPPPGYC